MIDKLNKFMIEFGTICAKVSLPSAPNGFVFFHLDKWNKKYSGSPTQSHLWSITQFPVFDFGHDDWTDRIYPRMRFMGSLVDVVEGDPPVYIGRGEANYYPNGLPSYGFEWLTKPDEVASLKYLLLVQEEMWKFCIEDNLPQPMAEAVVRSFSRFRSIPFENPETLIRLLKIVADFRNSVSRTRSSVFLENPNESSANLELFWKLRNLLSDKETFDRIEAVLLSLASYGLGLNISQIPRSR